MIRRPPRSTQSRSSAASDVYKRQIRHIAAPDRLCSSRDLEPLPREDVFQPVKRKVIRKLAGHDEGQQTGAGHALLDGCLRLGGGLHPRAIAIDFAGRADILLAHMVDCLLYTSDAADDLLCVDLGGRRIIKKK